MIIDFFLYISIFASVNFKIGKDKIDELCFSFSGCRLYTAGNKVRIHYIYSFMFTKSFKKINSEIGNIN